MTNRRYMFMAFRLQPPRVHFCASHALAARQRTARSNTFNQLPGIHTTKCIPSTAPKCLKCPTRHGTSVTGAPVIYPFTNMSDLLAQCKERGDYSPGLSLSIYSDRVTTMPPSGRDIMCKERLPSSGRIL
ncbi:hypothetical protein NHX12_010099 [Muraenolepis orangiensis]|uniref:Uncharacterized protein n=1 Tax=Muraenolepis orangiensis TaxID=630683 RepID=A0A9Q0DIX1_9TELE|nr:hypothetical protein NHX12_010099 [Muraenolepis orangiensis]